MPSHSITTRGFFLPRLLNDIGRRLEATGAICLLLDPSALIEEAKRRTGLTDFGGMEFLEPLNRLLTSCSEEANAYEWHRRFLQHLQKGMTER